MRLRDLELKDVQEIYSWVKNSDIANNVNDNELTSFEKVLDFIRTCNNRLNEKYFAIVNEEDMYEGTIGLKHIDAKQKQVEFSIVVKEDAMGKGYAWFGMVEILKYSFETLGMEKVYWYVSKDNLRAIRFFRKHGFNSLDADVPKDIVRRYPNNNDLMWFVVLREDDYENVALSRGSISDCKIIKIKTVPTIEAGELSFFEATYDIPFEIKRIYYISKVPEGARRGFHAHKKLKQILFCPFGKIQLILDNGKQREEITLNDPSIGIVIDKPIWREMLWLEKNSVLVVAASEFYEEDDYLRKYEAYLEYIK